MLQDLLNIIMGGGNQQPQPAQFDQSRPPIPTPNPETSAPGAGQPLAQPIQSPGMGQRIGNHFQQMDWKSAFDDAAAGMAGMDPTAPNLQAAAMGYSGARNSSKARDAAAQQAQLTEADRLTEMEKHQADMKSKKLSDLNVGSQIEERENKRDPNRPLDFAENTKIEELVLDYAQKLGLNSTSLSSTRRAEGLVALQEYRKQLTERVKRGVKPEEAMNIDGEGEFDGIVYDQENPGQPKTDAEFKSMGAGSYFINPADGSIRRKP